MAKNQRNEKIDGSKHQINDPIKHYELSKFDYLNIDKIETRYFKNGKPTDLARENEGFFLNLSDLGVSKRPDIRATKEGMWVGGKGYPDPSESQLRNDFQGSFVQTEDGAWIDGKFYPINNDLNLQGSARAQVDRDECFPSGFPGLEGIVSKEGQAVRDEANRIFGEKSYLDNEMLGLASELLFGVDNATPLEIKQAAERRYEALARSALYNAMKKDAEDTGSDVLRKINTTLVQHPVYDAIGAARDSLKGLEVRKSSMDSLSLAMELAGKKVKEAYVNMVTIAALASRIPTAEYKIMPSRVYLKNSDNHYKPRK